MIHLVNLEKKLKSLRIAGNYTQLQVADRLGVSKTIISAYENDLRHPSYENLIKLSKLYNVSTDWLLGNTRSTDVNFSELTDEQSQLIVGMIKQFEKLNSL